MQQQNDYSTAYVRDATSSQRGPADVRSSAPKMHDLTAFRFPRTPQAQRVRRPAPRQATVESVRQRQIDSAVDNAYKQYQQQPRQLTNEETLAYVQRIDYIGKLLEQERRQEMTRKDSSTFGSAIRLLTGSEKGVNLFLPRPTRRQLIQRESELGGGLFGAVPQGYHRQFFNLDPSTWVWYEEWADEKQQPQSTTTRYEVHENGVLKVQQGAPYYFIEGQELINLTMAVQSYYEKVSRDVYARDPATAQPLAA